MKLLIWKEIAVSDIVINEIYCINVEKKQIYDQSVLLENLRLKSIKTDSRFAILAKIRL